MFLPLPTIGNLLTLSLRPFSIDFPSSGALLQARSFSNSISERHGLFNIIGTYLGKLGVDGHACLLRTMCEFGSSPHHDNGIVGDVLDVLLSAANLVEGELDSDYKEYVEAEMDGKVRVDDGKS